MNSPALLPIHPNPSLPSHKEGFTLSILNGPEKGSIFKISGSTIKIGRSRDNDISNDKDPKMSRHHLKILIKSGEVYIESLSEKNPVIINKKPIQKVIIENHVIKQGFRFTAGNTEFELKSTSSNGKPLALQKNNAQLHTPSSKSSSPLSSFFPSPTSSSRQFQRKNPMKIVLFTVVGLLLLLLLSSDSKKSEKQDLTLRTKEDVSKDIDSQSKTINDLKKKNIESGKTRPQFAKSQAEYIKGFRDYRQGQYERAMQYFQGCLTIDPSHVLCKRYLTLSQKRFNEIIQHHMVTGKKFLDKKHYKACMTSFTNVMVMVKDPKDRVYLEAKSNWTICQHHSQGRF